MIKRSRRRKYGNRKVEKNGIKFDSLAESRYYPFAVAFAASLGLELRLQEKFELQPSFKLNGKTKRAITYTPDFTFWDGDQLVKAVDVKGVQSETFKVKAKLFCYKYGCELILAKYDYKTGLFTESPF